jgi:tetratricopeptide (TPR) repeat protein
LGIPFRDPGQYEKALAGMNRARELDPLNPSFANEVGWVHYHAERFDSALEHFQQRVDTTPDDMWANMGVATAALALRRFDDAIRWYAKSVEIGGGDSMAKAHLGWAYGRAGRTKEARAILDELTSRYPQEKFSPINFVFVYQGHGDMDNAFLWLDRCYETQDFYLIFLVFCPVDEKHKYGRA